MEKTIDHSLMHDPSEEAFNQLYVMFDSRVSELLTFLNLASEVNLEDILQRFWLRVHRMRKHCSPEVDVDVWMFQTAKSEALDFHKSERFQRECSRENIEGYIETVSEDVRTRRSCEDPKEALINVETREVVHRKIDELPDRQREVIKLTLSKTKEKMLEIADNNGLGRVVARTNAYAARQSLKKKLRSYYEI